jgi:uncharacterized protein YbjQ (UPF0145 family)
MHVVQQRLNAELPSSTADSEYDLYHLVGDDTDVLAYRQGLCFAALGAIAQKAITRDAGMEMIDSVVATMCGSEMALQGRTFTNVTAFGEEYADARLQSVSRLALSGTISTKAFIEDIQIATHFKRLVTESDGFYLTHEGYEAIMTSRGMVPNLINEEEFDDLISLNYEMRHQIKTLGADAMVLRHSVAWEGSVPKVDPRLVTKTFVVTDADTFTPVLKMS